MIDAEADDETLLQRSRAGDVEAIRLLVKRHLDTVFRIAFRMVGHRAQAEDIAQDVLMRMLSHRQGWFSKPSLLAWLRRAVINRAIDEHRKLRAWAFSELHEAIPHESENSDQERVVAVNQEAQRVADAVLNLPLRQRAAVNLCFYEMLSLSEAAAAMGTTPGAVESLLHRAKNTLRWDLHELANNGETDGIRKG